MRMRPVLRQLLVGLSFVPALSWAGFDLAFGAGGLVDVPGHSLAVQLDGKIVALGAATRDPSGSESWRFSLSRLTSMGAIDFARTDTIGSCSICGSQSATAATLVQPDGRILSVGTFWDTHQGCSRPYFVAIRHLASGEVDTSFGSSGVASVYFGNANGLALQPDGKPVIAGAYGGTYTCIPNVFGSPQDHGLVRLNADGSVDPGFGASGSAISSLASGDDVSNAVAIRPDGKIVAAGYASNGANRDFTLAVYSATGVLEASALFDVSSGGDDIAYALAVQPDGKILLGGSADTNSALVRVTAPGTYDSAFATGGTFTLPGAPIRAIALQADGKIVSVTGTGDVLRLDTTGALDQSFGTGGRISTGMSGVMSLALQADGRILVGSDTSVARIDPDGAEPITALPATVDFLGQSINTTTPPRVVLLTNTSGSVQYISSITAPTGFAVMHDCSALAVGASCNATVTFAPISQGLAAGDLVVTGSAGTAKVFLRGTGERSLTTHFYRSILRRAPDSGGKAFWDSEAARVLALGLDVNEVWFAMAQQFYTSTEYLALNRGGEEFVTDLFNSFLNRAPDADGLAYWKGQLDQGMPREVLLAAFMFSQEFANLTSAIFGNTAVRAELDTVTDFYRGLLSRLPDEGGFNFWLAKLRGAQCAGANAGNAVNAAVEDISSLLANSQEYGNRARSNSQFVGDLYNALLRRGGDLGGVQYWIAEITQNRRSRENVRQAFVASPEFQARVAAIIAQGCLQ